MSGQPSLADEVGGVVQVAIIGSFVSGKSSIVNAMFGARDAAVPGLPGFQKFRSQIPGQSRKYHVRVNFLNEDEIRHDIACYCKILRGDDCSHPDGSYTWWAVVKILRDATKYRNSEFNSMDFAQYFTSWLETHTIEEITADITTTAFQNLQSSRRSYLDARTLEWDTDSVIISDFTDDSGSDAGSDVRSDPIWPFIRDIEIHCKDMAEDLIIVECSANTSIERHRTIMNEVMRKTEIVIKAVDYQDLYCDNAGSFDEYCDPPHGVHTVWVLTGDLSSHDSHGSSFANAPSYKGYNLDGKDLEQLMEADTKCDIALDSSQHCNAELTEALRWTSSSEWQTQADLSDRVYDRTIELRKKLHIQLRAKEALHRARVWFGLDTDVKLFRIYYHVYRMLVRKACDRVKYADVNWTMEDSGVPAFLEAFNETLDLVRHERVTKKP